MSSPASIGHLQAKVAQIRKKYPWDSRPIGFHMGARLVEHEGSPHRAAHRP